nr:probable ubiquitin-conjugating enzyme E2 25 isoform X2 [Tanacetum cinerariifolium]
MSVVKEVENEATTTLLDLKTQRNDLIHAITREHKRLTTSINTTILHCDMFHLRKRWIKNIWEEREVLKKNLPDNYEWNKFKVDFQYVGYHSRGLEINPNLYKNGRVRLSLPKQTDMTRKVEVDMWVPGTSNMLTLLVSIQDQILNAKPFYNFFMFFGETLYKEESSSIYNEHILLKSLKIMVHIMSKPPNYFDDLVVGHFCNRARDILTACKAYTE